MVGLPHTENTMTVQYNNHMAILGFVLWVISPSLPLLAQSNPIVVVFDIDGRNSKLSKETLESLGDCLAASMSITAGFPIVLRDQIKAALALPAPAKDRRLETCFEYSCQVEIANILHADRILATAIHRMGGDCVVISTLTGTHRPVTNHVARMKSACGPSEINQAMDKIAEQFKRAVHDPVP